jgi:hypothetical protein
MKYGFANILFSEKGCSPYFSSETENVNDLRRERFV